MVGYGGYGTLLHCALEIEREEESIKQRGTLDLAYYDHHVLKNNESDE